MAQLTSLVIKIRKKFRSELVIYKIRFYQQEKNHTKDLRQT